MYGIWFAKPPHKRVGEIWHQKGIKVKCNYNQLAKICSEIAEKLKINFAFSRSIGVSKTPQTEKFLHGMVVKKI